MHICKCIFVSQQKYQPMDIAGLRFLLFLPTLPDFASLFTHVPGLVALFPRVMTHLSVPPMQWSPEAALPNTIAPKARHYPSPCPSRWVWCSPRPSTARSQQQPVRAGARARDHAPTAARGRRAGPRFPPNAKIYIEPQINFIIFSSLIMPTSAARPKLCTCILIHPSPPSLSALNFSVIIVRRRVPFRGREMRRLAAGRSTRSEVQAAWGGQGLCPVCGLLSEPRLVLASTEPRRGELPAAMEDLPS